MISMNTLQDLLKSLPDIGRKPFLVKRGKTDRQTYRYADLSATAGRLALGLIEQGIRPGDVVGFFAPLDFAWTAACLGALQAGAVVMPLDLQLEKETLAHILEDSKPRCVFADAGQLERLRQAGHEALSVYLLDKTNRDTMSWEHLCINDEQALPQITAGHRAALFYTSGTTGPPKGVPLSHGNLVFQINTVRRTGIVKSDDRVLLPLPPHHVYPFVVGILVPLSLGLTIVLPYALTGPHMVRALQEDGITLLFGVPRLYEALFAGVASRFESNAVARYLFDNGLKAAIAFQQKTGLCPGKWLLQPLRRRLGPNLRIMASGGAPLAPELALKLEAMGWQVAVGYGLTETAPLLTLRLPGDRRHDSVGRPVDGVRIRIDPQALPRRNDHKTSPKKGEVLADGPNVFSGYHNLPDKTRAVFTRDGWFRTGDLGYLDPEGYLYLTGRVSTLIVTKGGENIQPDDIEVHLSAHAVIQEAGVLQLENGMLAAVIVPELGEIRTQAIQNEHRAVQQAIAERSKALASYRRINDFVVTRTPLPRTRLGKIRRHLLADIFEQAKAARSSSDRAASVPVPISAMSAQDRRMLENPPVRMAWDWLADRYSDKPLSPDTSPELDLGVDSIEWLNITLEIRRRAGIELEEAVIGKINTVRDLLEAVAEKSTGGKTVSLESPLEAPERVLSDAQMRWLEPQSRSELLMAGILFTVNRFIVTRIFKLKARGLENLPAEGAFIITPNHVSYLDPFAVAAALGFEKLRRVFWAGFVGIAFKNPFFRYFSRLSRTVPVDPAKGVISSMAFGAAVLRRKQGLVWFPEGRRSPNGRLQPFKPGVGIILEHYPVPVIPAFIAGTERILPPGKAIPRLDGISVVFGRPLDAAALARNGKGKEKKERIASRLHEEVARLAKRTT